MLFNVDAGEGFGNEEQLLPYVDLVNISCGAHAGSVREMERVILLANEYQVKIGAHPSFPDLKNFGRVVSPISHQELKKSLIKQLGDFFSVTEKHGLAVFHIKPHGALYHEVAKNDEVAKLFFQVLKEFDFKGCVIGLPNSLFREYCKAGNIKFLNEAFADRAYMKNGDLVPRSKKGSVLKTQKEVSEQVVGIVKNKTVNSITQEQIFIEADTICFHGDHVGCEVMLKRVREALEEV